MAVEQVRILRVEGRAVGMQIVTSELNKVGDAATRVASAMRRAAVVPARSRNCLVSPVGVYRSRRT
jgi:hypothetical protein